MSSSSIRIFYSVLNKQKITFGTSGNSCTTSFLYLVLLTCPRSLFVSTGRPRRRLSVKDLPVTRSEVLEALEQNGLDKFFVEFRGYFSNHLLQACVALYNLSVSKEK